MMISAITTVQFFPPGNNDEYLTNNLIESQVSPFDTVFSCRYLKTLLSVFSPGVFF